MNFIFYFLFVISFLVSPRTEAHFTNENPKQLRIWQVKHKNIEGSFLMFKEDIVYVQTSKNEIIKFNVKESSTLDQYYVSDKVSHINELNEVKSNKSEHTNTIDFPFHKYILFFVVILILFRLSYQFNLKHKKLISYLLFLSIMSGLYSFTSSYSLKTTSHTDPLFIDSSFSPFQSELNTSWDSNYFYVESQGIPKTHTMMVGISNHGWQQQVPIPQCYLLPNAWSIPLHPSISNNPIPVDSVHFTRGAIALAINGVPIFNVHTNTGVDAFLDGQLDNFGGHCGRADDYHYHTAPLHLYNYTSQNKPIAFALDGFAVYGSKEPEGGNMSALDSNHGHFGNNGIYHYHGTSTAPYMIKNMVGNVTEDATHQLIPQAAAHGVRPALTPLNGALITSCNANVSPNGYTIKYTKNNQTYSVSYSWNNSGLYTFYFISPTNDTTTNTYNGFKPCFITNSISGNETIDDIEIAPNPTIDALSIISKKPIDRILIFDLNGQLLIEQFKPKISLSVSSLASGMYLVMIDCEGKRVVKKLVKH